MDTSKTRSAAVLFFSLNSDNFLTSCRCFGSSLKLNNSRNNVVEPVGNTSVVLDTVFGHDLEKE